MDNPDFLLQLSSRLDNNTLQLLSTTPAWNTINKFAGEEYFWYLRVRNLLGIDLQQRPDEQWKEAYYLIEPALQQPNPFSYVLSSPLAVEVLLEAGYDPTMNNNHALRTATRQGMTEVVRILLEDGRADPAAGDNYVIKTAAQRGYAGIMKLLLQDGRADPAASDNYSLFVAEARGYREVVNLLLGDPRIDPQAGVEARLGVTMIEQGQIDDLIDTLIRNARR